MIVNGKPVEGMVKVGSNAGVTFETDGKTIWCNTDEGVCIFRFTIHQTEQDYITTSLRTIETPLGQVVEGHAQVVRGVALGK